MPKILAERKIGLRCVLDHNDVDGIRDLIASTLSTDMRLLCHIIGWISLPKAGKFDLCLRGSWLLCIT